MKILKFFRIATHAHSPSFSDLPSPGFCISGKEVEVRSSGSPRFWHHLLCRPHNFQLTQSHVALSHGPPARVLTPLFFLAKSLLLPKLRGKKEHPKAARSSPGIAAVPGFKSPRPSSSAAPFPTPPTTSYTCQHPRILPP